MIQEVPIHALEVAAENPRSSYDDDAQRRLQDSISKIGLLEPLLVTKDGDVFYVLDGSRRLAAAQALGLTTLPVFVRDTANGARRTMAVSANLHRRQLTPIEEAEAFRYANETASIEEIADGYSVSEEFVRSRMRLLDLPEIAREKIDSRELPLAAAPVIQRIQDVQPELAEAIVAFAGEADEHVKLLTDESIYAVERAVREARSKSRRKTLLQPYAFATYEGSLDDEDWRAFAAADNKKKAQLEKIYDTFKAGPYYYGQLLSTENVDSARAYGCLLELGGGTVVTDPVWLLDTLIERIPEITEEQKGRREQIYGTKKVGDMTDDEKAARKKKLDDEKKVREDARLRNDELGAKLATRLRAKTTKANMILLGRLIYARYGSRITRGRIAIPDLVVTETTQRGTTKTTYANSEQTEEWFLGRLEKCKNADEALTLILRVMIACKYADQRALPQSQRMGDELPGEYGWGITPHEPSAVHDALDKMHDALEKIATPLLPQSMKDEAEERRKLRARDNEED